MSCANNVNSVNNANNTTNANTAPNVNNVNHANTTTTVNHANPAAAAGTAAVTVTAAANATANANAAAILIIEDEPAIADTLVYALRTEGFEPVWRGTGRDALAEIGARPLALVILDIGLPDINGFELCKQIRQRAASLPVLFLTARSAEIDRIVGLEIGGDDYVTKPFSPREVSARVKAILRRATTAPAPPPAHAPAPPPARPDAKPERARKKEQGFVHDAERCEIRCNGTPLDLTRYEYRLLKTLLSRPGRVFTRDALMEQAWEDPGASLDRTVDAHIKTLRAKLRAVTPDADPIQTHRGLGYSVRPAG